MLPGKEDVPKDVDPAEIFQVIRDGQAFREKVDDDEMKPQELPSCSDAQACLVEQECKHQGVDKDIASATMNICGLSEESECKSDFEGLANAVSKAGKFTLSLALQNHDTFEAAKHDLFLLNCYLRMRPGGCDSRLIANPLHARDRNSQTIRKWRNRVRHQVSLIEDSEKLPHARTSRSAAWVESCEALRKSKCAVLPTTLVVSTGQVVACWWYDRWHCTLILAVWRTFNKGCGAQLKPDSQYLPFTIFLQDKKNPFQIICFLP